ncbi:hypothetical protein EJF18_30238 [Clavispora lusitaniae]|uniref:Uncharacterized protein n=1 Tax=Clavispora lusitaniae TaxID=36911 RepID=A0ACD0WJ65_CLALS|nr:hypothetical protein EJF14_30238 [Clavispora lusitaniae]QFZ33421.1 hypothetical protein EJF16_30238 [Clavispora lusitaniae]QFZ39092.1 hypothetical protein EJF15_30238 [Clavispora lusitaniae]QFZ44774.1 hypothetical protein EJF18_30238 [Clavispora lusitaniae]QFZ50451.1 hypothetical protein EJF17_30238 [Clavispora lusitaniae]
MDQTVTFCETCCHDNITAIVGSLHIRIYVSICLGENVTKQDRECYPSKTECRDKHQIVQPSPSFACSPLLQIASHILSAFQRRLFFCSFLLLSCFSNLPSLLHFLMLASINFYTPVYNNMATPAAAAAPNKPAPTTWTAPESAESEVPLEWLEPLEPLEALAAETAEAAVKAITTVLNCILVLVRKKILPGLGSRAFLYREKFYGSFCAPADC